MGEGKGWWVVDAQRYEKINACAGARAFSFWILKGCREEEGGGEEGGGAYQQSHARIGARLALLTLCGDRTKCDAHQQTPQGHPLFFE